MKKNFAKLGLMFIATLALTTNCAKEEIAPEKEVAPENETVISEKAVPFELTVNSTETKTSTEDAATINWVADDAINVFHAVAGSTEYGSNDKFTITAENLSAKLFTGELQDGALEAENYDWYVLYPYLKDVVTPANPSKGYIAIGSKNASTAQVQNGNDSKAHLAGEYFPLYGKAENVPAATKPSITLKQALSVVKVHVTNANEDPLTVTSVSFTGTEDIVGTYYIDFSGETPAFKASGASYVSKEAQLTVTDGTPIAKNGSADFYIAIKPFTAAAGEVLKVSVNGALKSLTLPSDVTFEPGKIKQLNITYNFDPSVDYVTLPWDYAGGTSADLNAVPGVTTSGLGSDYADTHAPCQVKFDTSGDFIQIKTDSPIGTVSVGCDK